MSIDDNYDQDVKITIIATGFPESTQTEIIKRIGTNNALFYLLSREDLMLNC